eukprot:TRINITY_DN9736_c0_g1_i1.p1 TRINITY_DN9736_c0_g1~~TRINITY_DN9736_c0_g1_i1.p1  ORF type:complete len:1608 (-),score=324.95 TRINITY_DN9736_c0_g1_i1:408-5231(-)
MDLKQSAKDFVESPFHSLSSALLYIARVVSQTENEDLYTNSTPDHQRIPVDFSFATPRIHQKDLSIKDCEKMDFAKRSLQKILFSITEDFEERRDGLEFASLQQKTLRLLDGIKDLEDRLSESLVLSSNESTSPLVATDPHLESMNGSKEMNSKESLSPRPTISQTTAQVSLLHVDLILERCCEHVNVLKFLTEENQNVIRGLHTSLQQEIALRKILAKEHAEDRQPFHLNDFILNPSKDHEQEISERHPASHLNPLDASYTKWRSRFLDSSYKSTHELISQLHDITEKYRMLSLRLSQEVATHAAKLDEVNSSLDQTRSDLLQTIESLNSIRAEKDSLHLEVGDMRATMNEQLQSLCWLQSLRIQNVWDLLAGELEAPISLRDSYWSSKETSPTPQLIFDTTTSTAVPTTAQTINSVPTNDSRTEAIKIEQLLREMAHLQSANITLSVENEKTSAKVNELLRMLDSLHPETISSAEIDSLEPNKQWSSNHTPHSLAIASPRKSENGKAQSNLTPRKSKLEGFNSQKQDLTMDPLHTIVQEIDGLRLIQLSKLLDVLGSSLGPLSSHESRSAVETLTPTLLTMLSDIQAKSSSCSHLLQNQNPDEYEKHIEYSTTYSIHNPIAGNSLLPTNITALLEEETDGHYLFKSLRQIQRLFATLLCMFQSQGESLKQAQERLMIMENDQKDIEEVVSTFQILLINKKDSECNSSDAVTLSNEKELQDRPINLVSAFDHAPADDSSTLEDHSSIMSLQEINTALCQQIAEQGQLILNLQKEIQQTNQQPKLSPFVHTTPPRPQKDASILRRTYSIDSQAESVSSLPSVTTHQEPSNLQTHSIQNLPTASPRREVHFSPRRIDTDFNHTRRLHDDIQFLLLQLCILQSESRTSLPAKESNVDQEVAPGLNATEAIQDNLKQLPSIAIPSSSFSEVDSVEQLDSARIKILMERYLRSPSVNSDARDGGFEEDSALASASTGYEPFDRFYDGEITDRPISLSPELQDAKFVSPEKATIKGQVEALSVSIAHLRVLLGQAEEEKLLVEENARALHRNLQDMCRENEHLQSKLRSMMEEGRALYSRERHANHQLQNSSKIQKQLFERLRTAETEVATLRAEKDTLSELLTKHKELDVVERIHSEVVSMELLEELESQYKGLALELTAQTQETKNTYEGTLKRSTDMEVAVKLIQSQLASVVEKSSSLRLIQNQGIDVSVQTDDACKPETLPTKFTSLDVKREAFETDLAAAASPASYRRSPTPSQITPMQISYDTDSTLGVIHPTKREINAQVTIQESTNLQTECVSAQLVGIETPLGMNKLLDMTPQIMEQPAESSPERSLEGNTPPASSIIVSSLASDSTASTASPVITPANSTTDVPSGLLSEKAATKSESLVNVTPETQRPVFPIVNRVTSLRPTYAPQQSPRAGEGFGYRASPSFSAPASYPAAESPRSRVVDGGAQFSLPTQSSMRPAGSLPIGFQGTLQPPLVTRQIRSNMPHANPQVHHQNMVQMGNMIHPAVHGYAYAPVHTLASPQTLTQSPSLVRYESSFGTAMSRQTSFIPSQHHQLHNASFRTGVYPSAQVSPRLQNPPPMPFVAQQINVPASNMVLAAGVMYRR